MAATTAATAAIRAICQAGMPPVAMTRTVVCGPAGPPPWGGSEA
jgi:hypothetical protein